jgi:hydroxyacylglutathione hydrolase
MKIHKLELGFFNVNSYILETKKFSCLIDPGADYGTISGLIKERDINIDFILNTHGHYDHIGAVNEASSDLGVPFYIHRSDEPLIKDPTLNLSATFGNTDYKVEQYNLLDEGKDLFGLKIDLFNLPGHTPGCMMIKFEDIIFSGDVLFKGSIGRTDLVKGDHNKMEQSLKRFREFDRSCRIFPGHGPETTLDFEVKNNYYLKDVFFD